MGALLSFSLFPAMAGDEVGENEAGLRYWNEIKREAVTTESGLQYKALITGKGRKPGPRSKVRVHYRGLLLNGVTFDSSFDEDEPVKMNLKNVIKGWQEGIPLMPAGSVFVFLIPPELAYGTKGSDLIPPNATLIFEIELFGKK
jgi:FKBP-type peptidyl-prolyl cis-trans isomerase